MKKKPVLGLVSVALVASSAIFAADEATHTFEELAPGVYFAVEAGPVKVMSNSLVIIGEDSVAVVDSAVTPAAARGLLSAIGGLTDKPVSHLFNTHFHFDHAHGNQVFSPNVVIIGHEYTRKKLSGDPLAESTFTSFMEFFAQNLAELEVRQAEAKDDQTREQLREEIRVLADFLRDSKEIVPTPPTVALNDRLTLWLGGREIQLHFLGRGHTGGDMVVFLPEEKVVFTGDLLLPGPSYMGDGFVDEWVATLERLKGLDFEVVAPGHGAPFRDREHIDNIQAYLRDLWRDAEELYGEGVSAVEAALRIDLRSHESTLGVAEPGVDARAVLRIYQLLEAR